MEKRIDKMIEMLSQEDYDPEEAHGLYDSLLEDFIVNMDINLLGKMKFLISMEKEFWFA